MDSNQKMAFYTKKIISELPYWFKIRKHSKGSVGAAFLNVFGLNLDEIRFILDYAYKQCYINTADINQMDILYKAMLTDIIDINDIHVIGNNAYLEKAENIETFMDINQKGMDYQHTHSNNTYFLDEERKIIYVHEPYNSDSKYKDGQITVIYNDKEYIFALNKHHVWNYFDEFGLLLCCQRLKGETNAHYKERLLDVFLNPANSSTDGLVNGIARELGIRKNIIWPDGEKDLIIKDKMILLNRIKIDNVLVDLSDIYLNEKNEVVLLGNGKYKNVQRYVSYIHGIEIHKMNNYDDIPFINELQNQNGTATELLKYYVKMLNEKAPIKWDKFIWDESYWDVEKEENNGSGSMKHLYDGKIDGFKNYRG